MRYTKGAVLAGLILLSGAGYFGLSYRGAQQVTPEVERIVAKLHDVAQIQYDKVSYNPITQHVTLHNVKVNSANGDQHWAEMQKLAVKVDISNNVLNSVAGTISGLKFPLYPAQGESLISYLYQYAQAEKEALLELDAEGKAWGSIDAEVALGNYNPSLDLLYDYPSLQIKRALLTLHNKELVKWALYALNKNQVAANDELHITFKPQSNYKVAELMDNFPNNLVANNGFTLDTDEHPTSLIGWIEEYYGKLKRVLFKE
jgi:hypothetical protein